MLVTMETKTSEQKDESETVALPPKPEAPLPGDCCGNGCSPCILDLYDEEVTRWEDECRRIRLGLPSGSNTEVSSTSCLEKSEYSWFTVENITPHTRNTYLYRFSLPQGTSLNLRPGQHLVLRVKTSHHNTTRQYTPVSPADAVGYFEVLIKLYDDGRMSRLIRDWKVGSSAEWRGPFGEFEYKPNKYQRVLMLAAGTGIAPMLQVIQHVVDNEQDETVVRLVYCCRRYCDILMKDLLDEWAQYWNFTVTYVLSKDTVVTPNRIRYGDSIQYGHFTQENFQDEIGADKSNTLILICGTKTFEQDMLKYAHEDSIPRSNVFKF